MICTRHLRDSNDLKSVVRNIVYKIGPLYLDCLYREDGLSDERNECNERVVRLLNLISYERAIVNAVMIKNSHRAC